MKDRITNYFTKSLPSDSILENYPRQVREACYSYVKTYTPSNTELVHFSLDLKQALGIDTISEEDFIKLVSGKLEIPDFMPYAMCYGGHQFGHWAGQLGDGRAITVADIKTDMGLQSLQLKGSGPTPYSRTADGFAVFRSSVREYLCSEAMHHLGVPTTRALSLVKTGDKVMRDILYDGNPAFEDGAIVCRVSPSFIRFGNFEILAARKDIANLRLLADFTIAHFYPHLVEKEDKYFLFFNELTLKTKDLLVHWQRVGFVHGVMNTDNMSAIGLTMDYGPYGWLEDYNPDWTPNTTDFQHKRYRFDNQPNVGLWNLTQLANALYPLIEDVQALEQVLERYKTEYLADYHAMMLAKLGLKEKTIPKSFIQELTQLLTTSSIDFTLFFRELSTKETMNWGVFQAILNFSTYLSEKELENHSVSWEAWFVQYSDYLSKEDTIVSNRLSDMQSINPKYVLRNYMAQLAIEAGDKGDYSVLNELYTVLQSPYEEQPAFEKWYAKRPDWAKNRIGCSVLSCSS